MATIDMIQDILAKGNDLRQSDVLEIKVLSLDLDLEEYDHVMPWIWEAIALIVNAPEYTGDIEPID